jgi:hypothetical protein
MLMNSQTLQALVRNFLLTDVREAIVNSFKKRSKILYRKG